MKDELIRKSDVLKCLHLDYKDVIYINKNETAKLINAIKTVRVANGEWLKMDGYSKCSECGWLHAHKQLAFCPNCGADMRGEK